LIRGLPASCKSGNEAIVTVALVDSNWVANEWQPNALWVALVVPSI
jgi:hypothetical protein